MHRKYLFANFRMSHNYRSYKDFVPKYLHGRPHSVIQHCLERISSSKKYSREDIVTTEQSSGLFSIKSNEKTHTVDFGQATGHPSCTCQDWTNWQVPCKHFFAVFTLIPEWDWYRLPEKYLTSAYISRDSVSLESGLHLLLATGSHSLPVDDRTSVETENPSGPPETAGQEELPRKKVEISDLQFIYTCYMHSLFFLSDSVILQKTLGKK